MKTWVNNDKIMRIVETDHTQSMAESAVDFNIITSRQY